MLKHPVYENYHRWGASFIYGGEAGRLCSLLHQLAEAEGGLQQHAELNAELFGLLNGVE